jgi:hypothetical protein
MDGSVRFSTTSRERDREITDWLDSREGEGNYSEDARQEANRNKCSGNFLSIIDSSPFTFKL